MDFSAVAVIALLMIVAAVAVLIGRQGLLASTLPALRLSTTFARRQGGQLDSELPTTNGAGGEALSGRQTSQISPQSRAQQEHAVTPAVSLAGLNTQQPRSSPPSVEMVGAQLDRLDARLSDLTRTIDRHEAAISSLLQQSMSDIAQRAIAGDARIDAAVDRLRADVLMSVASMRPVRGDSRRQDVCAELYTALARFEAALAAVSNPVLLPGELYSIPDELPASALVWENWNDVGERVFVLADTFNAQRLHLSPQSRQNVGQFLTTLRTLLTGTIYPNLQSPPGSAQHLALRKALNQIAREMRDLQETLEREYEAVTRS